MITINMISMNLSVYYAGEGFNSVLDTVESSIGAPNPEELVELHKAGRMKEPQEGSNGTHPLGWLVVWMLDI